MSCLGSCRVEEVAAVERSAFADDDFPLFVDGGDGTVNILFFHPRVCNYFTANEFAFCGECGEDIFVVQQLGFPPHEGDKPGGVVNGKAGDIFGVWVVRFTNFRRMDELGNERIGQRLIFGAERMVRVLAERGRHGDGRKFGDEIGEGYFAHKLFADCFGQVKTVSFST